jgi:hypothetical protein
MIQNNAGLGEWHNGGRTGAALFANWNFQWYENYRIKDSRQLYGLLWTGAPIEIGGSTKGCAVCCGNAWFVRGKLKVDGDFFFVHSIFFARLAGGSGVL